MSNTLDKARRKRLVSKPVVAEVLGIGETTVQRMVDSGQLRAYRISERIVRYDLDDVMALARPM